MLKFYYSTQTCATAVRIAFAEANLPHEEVEVSWRRNVNVEELNRVSALGQVPVLVADAEVINQTPVVLAYVADHAPAARLLPPAGTPERRRAESWLTFVAADFQKSFLAAFMASRWTSDEKVQAEIRRTVGESITKQLAYINKALPAEGFLLGADFTVVDAYLFTILGWCKWAGVPVSPHERILPYMKRVYARPAVRKTLEQEDLLDFFPA